MKTTTTTTKRVFDEHGNVIEETVTVVECGWSYIPTWPYYPSIPKLPEPANRHVLLTT